MLRDPSFSRLYEQCPVWLWPIQAWSLLAVREEIMARGGGDGAGFDVRMTDYGWAYLATAGPFGNRPPWQEQVAQHVLGARWHIPGKAPAPLGIMTDDAQTEWAIGQFGRAHDRRHLSLSNPRYAGLYQRGLALDLAISNMVSGISGLIGPLTGCATPSRALLARAPP